MSFPSTQNLLIPYLASCLFFRKYFYALGFVKVWRKWCLLKSNFQYWIVLSVVQNGSGYHLFIFWFKSSSGNAFEFYHILTSSFIFLIIKLKILELEITDVTMFSCAWTLQSVGVHWCPFSGLTRLPLSFE